MLIIYELFSWFLIHSNILVNCNNSQSPSFIPTEKSFKMFYCRKPICVKVPVNICCRYLVMWLHLSEELIKITVAMMTILLLLIRTDRLILILFIILDTIKYIQQNRRLLSQWSYLTFSTHLAYFPCLKNERRLVRADSCWSACVCISVCPHPSVCVSSLNFLGLRDHLAVYVSPSNFC